MSHDACTAFTRHGNALEIPQVYMNCIRPSVYNVRCKASSRIINLKYDRSLTADTAYFLTGMGVFWAKIFVSSLLALPANALETRPFFSVCALAAPACKVSCSLRGQRHLYYQ